MEKINSKNASDYGRMSSRKGIPNKSTERIKKAFAELLENNLHTLQNDLTKLNSKDRLKFILDLTNYFLPKLKSQDIDLNNNVITQNSEIIEKLLQIDDQKFNLL